MRCGFRTRNSALKIETSRAKRRGSPRNFILQDGASCAGGLLIPHWHRLATPARTQSKHSPRCTQWQSGLLAVGLCAVQAFLPSVTLAITADDYDAMYKSSATANQQAFKMTLPKTPEAKDTKKQGGDSSATSSTFKIPELELPKFEVPTMGLNKGDRQSQDSPKAASFDFPSLPSFSAPSLPSFSGGTSQPPSTATPEAPPVNIELLDEEARATAKDFRQADVAAKQVEAQARALRSIANDKKQIAKKAKDAACEYRPGGKFICFRGFNSGF